MLGTDPNHPKTTGGPHESRTNLTSCILVVGLIVASVPMVRADVSPGDMIDKTNWEKAQGFLPEPVLAWVKKGDFILNIDEPNFKLADCFPPFQIEAFGTHVGKYELDADGGIIEAKTGKPPNHVVGLPFPKIADDDPRLAEKLMQNNHYMQYLAGNVRFHFQKEHAVPSPHFPTDDRRPFGPIGRDRGLHATKHMGLLCPFGCQLLLTCGIPEVMQIEAAFLLQVLKDYNLTSKAHIER